MDKRIRQTQNKLVAALRTLMQQQPYDGISVATICEQADVARSSYYTHFSGKQELFELSLRHLATELVSGDATRSLDATASFAFLPGFLDHIRSHRNIYLENRFSPGLPAIMRNIRSIAQGLARNELANSGLSWSGDEPQLLFVIGGLHALLEQWIESGCSELTNELLACLDELVRLGLGLQRS